MHTPNLSFVQTPRRFFGFHSNLGFFYTTPRFFCSLSSMVFSSHSSSVFNVTLLLDFCPHSSHFFVQTPHRFLIIMHPGFMFPPLSGFCSFSYPNFVHTPPLLWFTLLLCVLFTFLDGFRFASVSYFLFTLCPPV